MKKKLELDVIKNLLHWAYSEGVKNGKEGITDDEVSESLNEIDETLKELTSYKRPESYQEWMERTGEMIKGFNRMYFRK